MEEKKGKKEDILGFKSFSLQSMINLRRLIQNIIIALATDLRTDNCMVGLWNVLPYTQERPGEKLTLEPIEHWV